MHDAILDTTAALVAEYGLLSVTMSQVAEATGIGRATLYKYFSDVGGRLGAVLEAYAFLSQESHGHHDSELAAFLHGDDQLAQPQKQLHRMICDLVTEGAEAGQLRSDVAADELANYCLHALTAASGMRSKAAVRRLVTVILAGLRPGITRVRQPESETKAVGAH